MNDGWMDRRIKHLWKTHSVKLHIGYCQVCCQRMNYEGPCHTQEIGIHGGQGKNWAKEWTKSSAKAVASLCCWEVVQAATANSCEKSPQAGDGQGSLTMAASLLISASTHTHTHTHTHRNILASLVVSSRLPSQNLIPTHTSAFLTQLFTTRHSKFL